MRRVTIPFLKQGQKGETDEKLSWTWPPDGYSRFSLFTYTMWCVFHGLYKCYWLFYPVFYLQQGCMCVTLLHSSTCVSCITSYYYSFVQYYCTWSHRNGDCPGQVVQAMPPPFVPKDDIGDPDLSVIPPPVDYRCCCCVTFYPMEGIKFVFIFSFHFRMPRLRFSFGHLNFFFFFSFLCKK